MLYPHWIKVTLILWPSFLLRGGTPQLWAVTEYEKDALRKYVEALADITRIGHGKKIADKFVGSPKKGDGTIQCIKKFAKSICKEIKKETRKGKKRKGKGKKKKKEKKKKKGKSDTEDKEDSLLSAEKIRDSFYSSSRKSWRWFLITRLLSDERQILLQHEVIYIFKSNIYKKKYTFKWISKL